MLGRAIGVSSQQVQKYERGDNRISASRLYAIATALNCSVAQFYSEYDKPYTLACPLL